MVAGSSVNQVVTEASRFVTSATIPTCLVLALDGLGSASSVDRTFAQTFVVTDLHSDGKEYLTEPGSKVLFNGHASMKRRFRNTQSFVVTDLQVDTSFRRHRGLRAQELKQKWGKANDGVVVN